MLMVDKTFFKSNILCFRCFAKKINLCRKNSIRYNISGLNVAVCLHKNIDNEYKNFSNRICPDAYLIKSICKHSINRKKYNFTRTFVDYNYINDIVNYVLILIESPRSSEYDEDGNPLGPALGRTGRNLENNFKKFLSKISNNFNKTEKYTFVLINPIQFQTSLGIKSNRNERDKNWLRMWGNHCNDFIKRLNSFSPNGRNHIIVINLCSQGERRCRKNMINYAIKNGLINKNKSILLEGSHPCTSAFVNQMKNAKYSFKRIL